MRVFVTGATGFIGSAIVRELANPHGLVLVTPDAGGSRQRHGNGQGPGRTGEQS